MGRAGTAFRRACIVGCCLVSLLATGCSGGGGDDAEAGSRSSTPEPSRETGPPGPVTLRSGAAGEQPPSRIEGLPSELPESLEGMPDFAPRPGSPARVLFCPPETANDGTGWATEEIALFRDGSWSRLSLASVGLEEDLWPGGAPMGTGELSPDGRLIAWGTDDGVAVLDLYRGSTRLLLQGTGPVTGSRWLATSDVLLARRPGATDRLVVVGNGTSSPSPVETLSASVLASGDLGRLTPTVDGSLLTVFSADSGFRATSRRALDVRAEGRSVQGWGAGGRLALHPLVDSSEQREMRVVDLETGRPRGTLRWSADVARSFRVHGWVGDEAVLVSTDGALTAWDPARRVAELVATLPTSAEGEGPVGLSVAPAVLTAP